MRDCNCRQKKTVAIRKVLRVFLVKQSGRFFALNRNLVRIYLPECKYPGHPDPRHA